MNEKDTLNRLKIQERETRKSLILDAAKRVFSNKSYDKANMREIADEAGIATSSIYTYFPNQEALFVEAAIREVCILREYIQEMAKECATDDKRLESFINTFIEYIAKHESYFRMMVVFMTHGNLHEESLEKLNMSVREIFDYTDDIFRGLSCPGDVRKISHYLFSVLNGILVTYRKLPGRSEEELIAHMKELGAIMKNTIVNMRMVGA